jgi:hypothetical protein
MVGYPGTGVRIPPSPPQKTNEPLKVALLFRGLAERIDADPASGKNAA